MSMVIGVMSIAAMVAMAGYMAVRARFAATRRLIAVPLAMAAAEGFLFGLVSAVSNPAVFAVLIASRLTVLVCCALAMRADRDEAKARVRRRNRFRAEMYNVMYPLRLVRRQRATQCIDIAA